MGSLQRQLSSVLNEPPDGVELSLDSVGLARDPGQSLGCFLILPEMGFCGVAEEAQNGSTAKNNLSINLGS
jgi:hypothetical protein